MASKMTTDDLPVCTYWLSWYGASVAFTYNGPWWIAGHRGFDNAPYFNAAVRAHSEEEAKRVICMAHDEPVLIAWRFCELCPADWTPFDSRRFPKAGWMQWPWPIYEEPQARPRLTAEEVLRLVLDSLGIDPHDHDPHKLALAASILQGFAEQS